MSLVKMLLNQEFVGNFFLVTVLGLNSSLAEAAGKKQSDSSSTSCSPSSTLTTPNPVRYVSMRAIGTKAFTLNGSTLNLSTDLQNMLNTVVTQYSNIQPSSSSADTCGYHLEFKADVLDLELDIADASVTVGYSPTGGGTITNINGSASVNGGSIEMGFAVLRCSNPSNGSTDPEVCDTVVSSTSTHLTAGVKLAFTANFSEIKTSASFIYNTGLAGALQTIMAKGVQQLVSSSKLNMLPWQAQVLEANSSTGLFTFDAGTQSAIRNNQSFMVYSPVSTASTGVCTVLSPLAYAHTLAADTVTSTAQVDTILGRALQAGDIVMIRSVSQ